MDRDPKDGKSPPPCPATSKMDRNRDPRDGNTPPPKTPTALPKKTLPMATDNASSEDSHDALLQLKKQQLELARAAGSVSPQSEKEGVAVSEPSLSSEGLRPQQARNTGRQGIRPRKAAELARRARMNAEPVPEDVPGRNRIYRHPARKAKTPPTFGSQESADLSSKDKYSLSLTESSYSDSNLAGTPTSQRTRVMVVPGAYPVGGRRGQDVSEDLVDDSSEELTVDDHDPSPRVKVMAELVEEQEDVSALRERNNDLITQVQEQQKVTKVQVVKPFFRRPRNVAIAVGMCMAVVIAVAVAVVMATGRGDSAKTETLQPKTPPTLTTPSPSFSGSSLQAPSPSPDCVNLVQNLVEAVDAYLEDPSNSSAVAQEYGWPIGTWCTRGWQNFADLFSTRRNVLAYTFNEDLSGWDMSSATSTVSMFFNATDFNQNLSLWDMSQVEDTAEMFQLASSFDGDVASWDMSKVIDMSYMFDSATAFNQNISGWDVSEVGEMSGMFSDAKSFDQDLSSWTPHSARALNEMFYGATSFSGDLCAWGEILQSRPNIVAVTDMFNSSGCALTVDPDHTQNPYGPFCEPCTR